MYIGKSIGTSRLVIGGLLMVRCRPLFPSWGTVHTLKVADAPRPQNEGTRYSETPKGPGILYSPWPSAQEHMALHFPLLFLH